MRQILASFVESMYQSNNCKGHFKNLKEAVEEYLSGVLGRVRPNRLAENVSSASI